MWVLRFLILDWVSPSSIFWEIFHFVCDSLFIRIDSFTEISYCTFNICHSSNNILFLLPVFSLWTFFKHTQKQRLVQNIILSHLRIVSVFHFDLFVSFAFEIPLGDSIDFFKKKTKLTSVLSLFSLFFLLYVWLYNSKYF